MTRYKRGDVVLLNFGFSAEGGAKRRPALVVSSDAYHKHRHEIMIAAITSNVGRPLVGDHLVSGWHEAGLLSPSIVTGIVRTIKQSMVYRRLGTLPPQDLNAIDNALAISFDLVLEHHST